MAETDVLSLMASQLGISITLFVIIIIWSLVWKLLALWKSARNNSPVWFIVLAVVNTLGILEILYIFVFSKMNMKSKSKTVQAIPIKTKRRKKR